jgi:hypothetical protein
MRVAGPPTSNCHREAGAKLFRLTPADPVEGRHPHELTCRPEGFVGDSASARRALFSAGRCLSLPCPSASNV